MIFIKEKGKGLWYALVLPLAALLLGQWIPIIGGPVFCHPHWNAAGISH